MYQFETILHLCPDVSPWRVYESRNEFVARNTFFMFYVGLLHFYLYCFLHFKIGKISVLPCNFKQSSDLPCKFLFQISHANFLVPFQIYHANFRFRLVMQKIGIQNQFIHANFCFRLAMQISHFCFRLNMQIIIANLPCKIFSTISEIVSDYTC